MPRYSHELQWNSALVISGIEAVLCLVDGNFPDVAEMLFWVVGVTRIYIPVERLQRRQSYREMSLHEPMDPAGAYGRPFGASGPDHIEGSIGKVLKGFSHHSSHAIANNGNASGGRSL